MDEQGRENDATADDREGERREEGEENRKELDEIPPHGTDPLHEGP